MCHGFSVPGPARPRHPSFRLIEEFRTARDDRGLRCWLSELIGEARSEALLTDESFGDRARRGLELLDSKESRRLLWAAGNPARQPDVGRFMRKWLIVSAVALLLLVGSGVGLYVLMNSRTFQLFGGLTYRVDTDEKVVALTFDDGPSDKGPSIEKALAGLRVPATFFLIGSEMEKHPGVAERLVAQGDQLGNHSYSHTRMVFVGADFVASEIERTDALIRRAGYGGEIVFRPPYSKKIYQLPKYLADHGRKTITWDVEPDSDSGDPASDNPNAIASTTLDQVRPGSIILLHPWNADHDADLAALPRIVDGLRAKGYRFVTVNDLLTTH
ncbi:polysaccharide deacetylase family protein [Kutzneria buriramensis]